MDKHYLQPLLEPEAIVVFAARHADPAQQTAQGRALKKRLVPLAEETNRISTRNLDPADLATARRVLLGMLFNLTQEAVAQDEAALPKPTRRRRKQG